MTSTTSAIASASVISTSRIDSATTWVVLNATWYFRPGGKCSDEPVELGADPALDVERVGRRQLHHAEADGVDALEAQLRCVGFGAELHRADVLQPDERRRRPP